jgi:virginiamycin A acetyltransferase
MSANNFPGPNPQTPFPLEGNKNVQFIKPTITRKK